MLKHALALCALVSSLFSFQTPALAIAIVNDFVQLSFVSEPIPIGTSISFSPGSTNTSNSQSGNALATIAAVASTPGSATALLSGFAGPPSGSFSASAFADGSASLFNDNPASVTFPLTFSQTRNLNTSAPGPNVISQAQTLALGCLSMATHLHRTPAVVFRRLFHSLAISSIPARRPSCLGCHLDRIS